MPRLVALGLAVWFAMFAQVAAAQVSPEAVIGDVDAFWAANFAAAGREYVSPQVVVLDGPVSTACGEIDPRWGPAAYCGGDETIYYAPVWFAQFAASGSDFSAMTVLAHEWGHHIQRLLGIPWSPTKEYELQADCLAGAYAANAEAEGLIPPGTIGDAVRLAALSGDPKWLPTDAPEHGSMAERGIAVMSGYQQGFAGCGIALA